jgi:hypothetical protein
VRLIQEEYDAGRAQAIVDQNSGTRKMYAELRGAWGRFYFDLMRDRYGVFVVQVSDITSEGPLSYQRGYNSVVREYVESIDGPGALNRVWDEVTAFRTALYKKHFDRPD